MRACGWLLGANLLLLPHAAQAAPRRVASLNLCTDELLLLLADPKQIVSVSHLGRLPAETALWRRGRAYRANDGSLVSVVPLKPDLVVTMGSGGGQDRERIAGRLGMTLRALSHPQSLGDVETSIAVLAGDLGREAVGRKVIQQIQWLRRTSSTRTQDTIWLGGGGRSVAPTGLAAQWMRLAGLRQRPLAGERATLEQLLVAPPPVLLRSDYRQAQYSAEQSWLSHPLARRSRAARTLATDGRRWTCMGPSLIGEILRLRRLAA